MFEGRKNIFGEEWDFDSMLIKHGIGYLEENDYEVPHSMKEFDEFYSNYSPSDIARDIISGGNFGHENDNFQMGADYFYFNGYGNPVSLYKENLLDYYKDNCDEERFYEYCINNGYFEEETIGILEDEDTELTQREIEDEVKAHINNVFKSIENSPYIYDVVFYRPEEYGFKKDDKIHILLSFKNKESGRKWSEDGLFNLLSEEKTCFNNVNDDENEFIVDINPIDIDKSGTVYEYLSSLDQGDALLAELGVKNKREIKNRCKDNCIDIER